MQNSATLPFSVLSLWWRLTAFFGSLFMVGTHQFFDYIILEIELDDNTFIKSLCIRNFRKVTVQVPLSREMFCFVKPEFAR